MRAFGFTNSSKLLIKFAAFINSSLNRSERETRYEAIAEGKFKLLYVTPERFRKTEFLEKSESQQVDLLAVDEAHCISEWGHDFRPDYTRLDAFRKLIDCPATIALTATATPDERLAFIHKYFGLPLT